VQSRPSRFLALMTVFIVAVALSIPFLPIGPPLGFVRPPRALLWAIGAIVLTYLGLTQVIKSWYVKSTVTKLRLRPCP